MANGNILVKALNILPVFFSVLFLNPLHDAGMPVTHDKKGIHSKFKNKNCNPARKYELQRRPAVTQNVHFI